MTGKPPSPRATRQRAAIMVALADAETFLSAQELYDKLRSRGAKVGLTTVYRTLQWLNDQGEIDALHVAGKEAAYRRCGTADHHHHLVCRSCGRAEELASAAVEEWTRRSAQSHGFTAVTHTVEIYGLCGSCASGGD